MFYDTSAAHGAQRPSFLTLVLRPWQMLGKLMADRQTCKDLSSLDDHILKDIGLSRGGIHAAIREARSRR